MFSENSHELGGLWLTCIDVESCGEGGADSEYKCGICGECDAPSDTDEMMLAAIESETVKITLGVDSGAEVTCVRPDIGTDYPLVKVNSRQLRGAGGGEIASYGDRHIGLSGTDGQTRILRCAVADVRKNLLAVSELVDKGHDVLFSRRGSYIKHVETGWKHEITRKRCIFEIEMDVVPHFRGAPPAGRR